MWNPVRVGPTALTFDFLRSRAWNPSRLGQCHMALWAFIGPCSPALVGHMSDHCTSRFGRRRPFISVGAVSIAIAVLIFAADIGRFLGDRGVGVRPRAIGVFVFGFWILDVANNVTQGPCRALLADLTGTND